MVWLNFDPRVFSAFKMAAQRRPWRTAGHVTTKLANCEPTTILKQSNLQYFWRHVACCSPGSSSHPPAILKAEMALGTRLGLAEIFLLGMKFLIKIITQFRQILALGITQSFIYKIGNNLTKKEEFIELAL